MIYSVVRGDRCKINFAFYILIIYHKNANTFSKIYIFFTDIFG